MKKNAIQNRSNKIYGKFVTKSSTNNLPFLFLNQNPLAVI